VGYLLFYQSYDHALRAGKQGHGSSQFCNSEYELSELSGVSVFRQARSQEVITLEEGLFIIIIHDTHCGYHHVVI
jgi:hypothetical protein